MSVRRNKLIMVALLLLAIEVAYRSYIHGPTLPIDPATGVGADGSVPAAVMSNLRHACFDCHSDETRWPWYSRLPVASWLIERDVEEGRARLNFSRWTSYNRFDRADMLDKACDKTMKREMPLRPYRLLHREARLADSEIAALCGWSRQEAARLVEGES